jgi:hypothetical protein
MERPNVMAKPPPIAGNSPRQPLSQGAKIGLIGAIATIIAAVATVVGALIQAGTFAGGSGAATGTSAGSTTIASYEEFKTVSDGKGTLEVHVPAAWELHPVGFDFGVDYRKKAPETGPGLVMAPPEASESKSWAVSSLTFSASRPFVRTLKAGGGNEQSVLERIRTWRKSDAWEEYGCTLIDEGEFRKTGYFGLYQKWSGCGALARFSELVAVSSDRSHVVIIQTTAAEGVPLSIGDVAWRTFKVDEDQLPA